MNKIIKDALILTIITLIAGVALGFVSELTKEPREQAKENTRQEAFKSLFSDADSFEDFADFDEKAALKAADETLPSEVPANSYTSGDVDFDECLVAYDKDGTELGKIFTVTSHKGYGGDIIISVGIDNEGLLTGYSITKLSETPGLGMKSTEDKFSSQFKKLDKSQLVTVSKQGKADGAVEAISGATITSRAVTNAVDCVMAYSNYLEGGAESEAATETTEEAAPETPAEAATEQTQEGGEAQ